MSSTPNLERWRHRMLQVCSPDNFIDMGFYFMIAAALQRRVWCGSDHEPIYPNLYVILIGPPGVGKGLVIGQVEWFLKYHKRKRGALELTAEELKKLTPEQMIEAATEQQTKDKKDKDDLLIPVGSTDCTYEAMLRAFTRAYRGVKVEGKPSYAPTGMYFHKSLVFCIEELSSMLKRDAHKVCNFLLPAYSCKDYDYETKNQGMDYIRKICLNFVGGTTPAYMQEVFDNNILDTGFAARTMFVFAFSNRKTIFSIPNLTVEQLIAEKEILEHVKRLTNLCGPVKFDPEGFAILRDEFEDPNFHTMRRVNKSIKLNEYYQRWNLHSQKMAMIMHFSESTDMVVSKEACIRAMDFLRKIEINMHHALASGNNKLAGVAKKMARHIRAQGEQSEEQLFSQFYEEVKDLEFKEVINYLLRLGLVTQDSRGDGKGKVTIYYKWMEQ